MEFQENRIHLADCLVALTKLPSGIADLVFADPPFNIGFTYDVYDDQQEREDYLSWSRRWIAGVHRALKADGTFWLAIGDEYAAELKILAHEIGFHCRSWVIWYYTFGVNCTMKFSRSHVHLFHFVKDVKCFTFNASEIRVPSARQLVYADIRANPDGRLPDDTWILRPQDCVGGFTSDEDTWYFPRVAGTFKERAGFHGCQMPEQLLGRIVRSSSRKGELVLDPFSGSSTTLVVAKKLGRRFLGFDISDDYISRGMARLAAVRIGDTLEGAKEPLVSAPATINGKTRDHKAGTRKRSVPLSNEKTQSGGMPELLADDAIDGIVDAYVRTRDGFSLDRVVADVALNAQFLGACVKLGLPGKPVDWNRMLFRLRKAGRLSGLPTTRRTEFSWRDCDHVIDASEIAWQRMAGSERRYSLDDLFCDPKLAAEFDRMATAFAPGFESLRYRWAAFKIRKEAKKALEHAQTLSRLRRSARNLACDLDFDKFAGKAGVYIVRNSKRNALYVGETFDLGERLGRNFCSKRGVAEWTKLSPFQELTVEAIAIAEEPSSHESEIASGLLARQAFLAKQYQPKFNSFVLYAM